MLSCGRTTTIVCRYLYLSATSDVHSRMHKKDNLKQLFVVLASESCSVFAVTNVSSHCSVYVCVNVYPTICVKCSQLFTGKKVNVTLIVTLLILL